MPDHQCPSNYPVGLTVATQSEAEVEYLDDIPACAQTSGAATYLQNDSPAVWVLRSTNGLPLNAFSWDESAEARVYRELLSAGRVLLMPGGKLTVGSGPEQLAWDIDLGLSLKWEAHDLVYDKLVSFGTGYAIAALNRRTVTGAALAKCTFSAATYVDGLGELDENSDLTDAVLTGLSGSIAGTSCLSAARQVAAADNSRTLATELGYLARDTQTLTAMEGRLSTAARGARVMNLIRWALPG